MKTPTLYLDDGSEELLPFKWKICPKCDGHGTSSAYLGAFTASQMQEDPDFAEEYMNGYYDRECETCSGGGKVKVVDEARLSPEKRKAWRDQEQDLADTRAIERQERLMEGGWREMEGYGFDD